MRAVIVHGMSVVPILHRDAHLVIVDKDAGILSVPTPRGEANTLVDLISTHLSKGQKHHRQRSAAEGGERMFFHAENELFGLALDISLPASRASGKVSLVTSWLELRRLFRVENR